MNRATCLLSVALLLTSVPALAQQTLVTEGVLDVERVTAEFLKESKQFRDVEAYRQRIAESVARFQAEIADLQSQRNKAVAAKDDRKTSQLDAVIAQRTADLQYYTTAETARLNAVVSVSAGYDNFIRTMLSATKSVAEAQGMMAVRKLSGEYLYYAPELDITDKVIEKMRGLLQSQ